MRRYTAPAATPPVDVQKKRAQRPAVTPCERPVFSVQVSQSVEPIADSWFDDYVRIVARTLAVSPVGSQAA